VFFADDSQPILENQHLAVAKSFDQRRDKGGLNIQVQYWMATKRSPVLQPPVQGLANDCYYHFKDSPKIWRVYEISKDLENGIVPKADSMRFQ
jgi:hypothetical protein